MGRRSILELYELCEVIEAQTTVLAAQRVTEEDIARARQALETMINAGDAGQQTQRVT